MYSLQAIVDEMAFNEFLLKHRATHSHTRPFAYNFLPHPLKTKIKANIWQTKEKSMVHLAEAERKGKAKKIFKSKSRSETEERMTMMIRNCRQICRGHANFNKMLKYIRSRLSNG